MRCQIFKEIYISTYTATKKSFPTCLSMESNYSKYRRRTKNQDLSQPKNILDACIYFSLTKQSEKRNCWQKLTTHKNCFRFTYVYACGTQVMEKPLLSLSHKSGICRKLWPKSHGPKKKKYMYSLFNWEDSFFCCPHYS